MDVRTKSMRLTSLINTPNKHMLPYPKRQAGNNAIILRDSESQSIRENIYSYQWRRVEGETEGEGGRRGDIKSHPRNRCLVTEEAIPEE